MKRCGVALFTERLNLMSGLLTLSHAIWFTRSIIKDEFKIRKGATWKKIEFQPSLTFSFFPCLKDIDVLK